MSESVVQNSFGTGEISPHLYGQTNLEKYHSAMMLMQNAMVDYRGGSVSRPGLQYIGTTRGGTAAALKRFVFSSQNTYLLVFTDQALQFIRNPLTPGHINASNAGFILSGGTPYTVATPWLEAELHQLKFSQSADTMIITHPNYEARQLTRISDTNWTLGIVAIGSPVARPGNLNLAITGLPSGSTDPQNTNYAYVVTAVDQDGQESQISNIATITGVNIAATQGTITLRWAQVVSAQFYNCYKAVPAPGGVLVPPGSPFGFIGTAYGTAFTDSNIIADFSQTPPQRRNPFAGGQVVGVNISASGSGYLVGGTIANISDPNGASALIVPVLDSNTAGGTGQVTGFYIVWPGAHIANGAAVVVTGGGGAGFAGTVVTTSNTGTNPSVSSYFQGRRLYAGSDNQPLTLWGSKPAFYNNFDRSNPPVDSDAYEFTISAQEVNRIKHLISMPGGLVIFNDGAVVQLSGGSLSVQNPVAVTPSSAVIVPQSNFGAADPQPILINYEILYVQSEGATVRDLSYNFYVNTYTGADITLLAGHLFYPRTIIDWAYQDTPNKTVWAVRDDGLVLALAYLKEQNIYAWTQHVMPAGIPTDVETVREGNSDATYFVVNRVGGYTIERLADRIYYDVADAWCLDGALFLPRPFPNATLTPPSGASIDGATNMLFTADAPVFGLGHIGSMIQGYGNTGRAIVTSVPNFYQVVADVFFGFGIDPVTAAPAKLGPNAWTLAPRQSVVTGLGHLEGYQVYALVDGVPQGPFTVSGGSITLTTAGFNIVVGLRFEVNMQQLPPAPPQAAATQDKRNRTVSSTIRVMNTGNSLQVGTSFQTLRTFRPGLSSTDTPWRVPYPVPGLINGEMRLNLDAEWNTQGGVCIRMSDPLPVSVLSILNEIEGLR